MNRRELLVGGTTLGLAAFFAQGALSQSVSTLRFVPLSGLVVLDPVTSTSVPTRNHAFLVFETLYTRDENYSVQPQMASHHEVNADFTEWTFTLRDGLKFHNGEPVLAIDVAASLERWVNFSVNGLPVRERLESITALDDTSLRVTLARPLPMLLTFIARSTPAVMPATLAASGATAVTEVVGSGPFRFVAEQFVPGERAVYEPFEGYVPRAEGRSFLAGAREALIRIESQVIADNGTAVAALMNGEVDWIDQLSADLAPLLDGHPNATYDVLDNVASIPYLCFNHTQGPTSNPKIRAAILAALDQAEIMRLTVGDERLWEAPVGCFNPNYRSASTRGFEHLGMPRRDPTEVKAMLDEAGYDGQPLVALHSGNHAIYGPLMQVVVPRLREVGLVIDDIVMDQNAVFERRLSKEPLENGGWSFFITAGSNFEDPTAHQLFRGIGDEGFYGWSTNRRLEELREAWLSAPSEEEQDDIAGQIQEEALSTGQWAPLGMYYRYSGWRRELNGVSAGQIPVLWGVDKA